jgi:hypothetical protein
MRIWLTLRQIFAEFEGTWLRKYLQKPKLNAENAEEKRQRAQGKTSMKPTHPGPQARLIPAQAAGLG